MSDAEWALTDGAIDVLIAVGISALIAFVISKAHGVYLNIKNSTDERWYAIRAAVEAAVEAAEQIGLDGRLKDYATDKFELAKGLVQAQLDARGIKLDFEKYADAIAALIESEVHRQFPKKDES